MKWIRFVFLSFVAAAACSSLRASVFTLQPTSTEAFAGESATIEFSVTYSGWGDDGIIVWRGSENLSARSAIVSRSQSRVMSNQGSYTSVAYGLRIDDLQLVDSTAWTVELTVNGQRFSDTTSEAFTILVKEPTLPVVVSAPESLSIPFKAPFSFALEVTGDPAPAVQWYRNDVLIPGASGTTYGRAQSVVEDGGVYKARVSNLAGAVWSEEWELTIDVTQYLIAAQPSNALAGSTSGAGFYPEGESASLLASAEDGYVFDRWTGDIESVANPLEFVATSEVAVVAQFREDERDMDGDGLSNYHEVVVYGTSPSEKDSDGDGVGDKMEVDHGLNPLTDDSTVFDAIKLYPIILGLSSSQDVQAAVAAERQRIVEDPSSEALFNQSGLDAAVAQARQAIIDDPASVNLFGVEGGTYFRMGTRLVEVDGEEGVFRWRLERSDDLQSWMQVGVVELSVSDEDGPYFFRYSVDEEASGSR